MNADALTVTTAIRNAEAYSALKELLERELDATVRPFNGRNAKGLFAYELSNAPHADPAVDFDRIAKISAMPGVEEVFVFSSDLSPDLLMNSMRSGVKEFLPLPIDEGETLQALLRFAERRETRPIPTPTASLEEPENENTGRGIIIQTLGAKSGLGVTTCAVNLATSLHAMAKEHDQKVAIVDMNLGSPDIPLFLDMDPLYNWGEMARNVGRLDETYVMSVFSRHGSGLYVLPAPNALEEEADLPASAMEKLFDIMRDVFDYTIVDSGGILDEVSLNMMTVADKILIMSSMSLPSLSNLKRLDEALEKLGAVPEEKIKLVFNRYLANGDITAKDAEKILGKKAQWLIPDDYNGTLAAMNQGKPLNLTVPKSAVTKAIQTMARDMARSDISVAPAKVRKGFFLFNLFRKAAPASS